MQVFQLVHHRETVQGSSLLIGDRNGIGNEEWGGAVMGWRCPLLGLGSLIAFLTFYSVQYTVVAEALRPVAVGMVMTSQVAVSHLGVPKCIVSVSRNNSECRCGCGLHK